MKTLADCIDTLIDQHGTLRAVARATRLDVGYLSRLHRGEKDQPSDETLAALGLRRHVMYEPVPPMVAPPLTRCAAGRDGDCINAQCPQLRDGEPHATGRHCPLDA